VSYNPPPVACTPLRAQRYAIASAGRVTVQIAAYERTWVEGLNRGDVSVADHVFANDCVIHINGSPERNLSLDGFKQMVSGLLAAFPDLHFAIEDQIAAGDKVATRWVAGGCR
jgi:predicted ester cyclase